MITIDDFKKIEIKIGTILSAEKIEGADRLLKLMVNFGGPEPVQILSGIAQHYEPSVLVGRQAPFIINLEPRTLKGLVSHGMILVASVQGVPVLILPEKEVAPGSVVQ